MPRITQYIRNDDMAAWEAIENKSEWIHIHLMEKRLPPTSTPMAETIAKNDAVVKLVNANGIEHGICKIHLVPLTIQGKCLQKGCKYA